MASFSGSLFMNMFVFVFRWLFMNSVHEHLFVNIVRASPGIYIYIYIYIYIRVSALADYPAPQIKKSNKKHVVGC